MDSIRIVVKLSDKVGQFVFIDPIDSIDPFRPNGMHTCAYSFSEHDYDFYTSADFLQLRTPPFYCKSH